MFVKHRSTVRREMFRVYLILALAGGICLALAGWAWGEDGVSRPPRELPPQLLQQARPMPDVEASSLRPQAFDSYAAVVHLWSQIEKFQAGQWQQALAESDAARLPRLARPWQHLGDAVAWMRLDNLQQAKVAAATARRLAPDNPLPYFVMGQLRLTEAALRPPRDDVLLVSAIEDPRDSDAVHAARLTALGEFRQAIAAADNLKMDQSLIGEPWVTPDGHSMPLQAPTVLDYLAALDLQDFEGLAHLESARIYLRYGDGAASEPHLDLATDRGIDTEMEYLWLGYLYQTEQAPLDAARVQLKAMRSSQGILGPMRQAIGNFGKALFGG